MGIYIKGMEMPENCIDCPITKPYSCWIVGIIFSSEDESWIYKQRPNWCPLVEITAPHGRLIDADTVLPRIEAEISMYKQRLANLPEEPNAVHQNAENTRKRVKGNLLDARASRNELQELIEKSPTIIEEEE